MDSDYKTVRIFIDTSARSPARVRAGVGVWLVEYMYKGAPITKDGVVNCENTTEAELTLEALIGAVTILTKPCNILFYSSCRVVLNAFENGWFIRWQQEDWHSRGKPIRHREQWEKLIERLEPHIYTMRGGRHDYSMVMDNRIRKELEKWQEALSKNTQTS